MARKKIKMGQLNGKEIDKIANGPHSLVLDGKEDIRSSYYLEDVATEFQVQGLELDWACVTWDGDFRYSPDEWKCFSFVGSKWQNINKEERELYLKNAYRVLLTRARQGIVVVVQMAMKSTIRGKQNFMMELLSI